MATWDDLKTDVITWTNKPTRVAETELALRQAIRKAHRLGKFWRDLVILPVTLPADPVQSLSIADDLPRFRQIGYVNVKDTDIYFDPAETLDLLDNDKNPRLDVYYAIGEQLYIRPSQAYTQYEIAYYRQPVTTPPESIDDWLLADYRDVVVLLAASTVLGVMGEQEIKRTVDGLLAISAADLVADNIEIKGR
jgi:hypothetical protein